MTTLSRLTGQAVAAPLPWVPLASRTGLFLGAQLVIAALLAAAGESEPWARSAHWWPLSGALANIVSIALLLQVMRRERVGVTAFLGVRGGAVGRDAALTVIFLLAAAVLAVVPNVALSALLFGDPQGPVAQFIQPLPRWAAWVGLVAFPLTIAIAELPTYFVWARRRLLDGGASATAAWVIPALFLSAQHVTLPLVADARFVAWRLLMFLPFALLVGFTLHRRPRLLPWLMVCHGLLDLSAARLVFMAS